MRENIEYMKHNNSKKPLIGLGSFAFKYAFGNCDVKPEKPMTVTEFLSEACSMRFDGVQLCENLNYSSLSDDELLGIARKAEKLGLFIDIGMNNLNNENLQRHIYISRLLKSKFLRIVIGEDSPYPVRNKDKLILEAEVVLREMLPVIKKSGIKVGIENHFDIRSKDLVKIMEDIGNDNLGLIFDSTNSLGFIEKPEETLQLFSPYLLSIHLKDYSVKKVTGGFNITGVPYGYGDAKLDRLVKMAIGINPDITIIMEMPIRRVEKQSVKQILEWENNTIKESMSYLKDLLSEL